jgi:RNA polymerase sigma factor for flagellar operon FliA
MTNLEAPTPLFLNGVADTAPSPEPALNLDRRPLCPPGAEASSVDNPSVARAPAISPTEQSYTQWDEELLFTEYLPLVRAIASRIHRTLPRHVLLDDLIQAGVIGLLDAMTKYDPGKQTRFQGYARFRIRGAIIDDLREMDWSPRDLRRKSRLLEKTYHRLRSSLGQDPSEPEVAVELGVTLPELQSLKTEIARLRMESMVAWSAMHGKEIDLRDSLPGRPEETPLLLCLRSEKRKLLMSAIAELPLRLREVMMLYYCEHLTMKEVGSTLGLGESRISQLHSIAVTALRILLTERPGSQEVTSQMS